MPAPRLAGATITSSTQVIGPLARKALWVCASRYPTTPSAGVATRSSARGSCSSAAKTRLNASGSTVKEVAKSRARGQIASWSCAEGTFGDGAGAAGESFEEHGDAGNRRHLGLHRR